MTVHSNAKILKAYSDNTDLVIFMLGSNSKWNQTNPKALMDYPDDEFFACLPQHKEACLHWLNGGEIEYDNMKNWIAYDLTIDNPKCPLQDFTGLEFNFRIKPRKEKRWIGFSPKSNVVTGMSFSTKESLAEHVNLNFAYPEYVQAIEIEVEV